MKLIQFFKIYRYS